MNCNLDSYDIHKTLFLKSVELISYETSINILSCAFDDVSILQIPISDDWIKYIFYHMFVHNVSLIIIVSFSLWYNIW